MNEKMLDSIYDKNQIGFDGDCEPMSERNKMDSNIATDPGSQDYTDRRAVTAAGSTERNRRMHSTSGENKMTSQAFSSTDGHQTQAAEYTMQDFNKRAS